MQFITGIKEHRFLGDILMPYLIDIKSNKEFYTIRETLNIESIGNTGYTLSEDEKKLIKDYGYYTT